VTDSLELDDPQVLHENRIMMLRYLASSHALPVEKLTSDVITACSDGTTLAELERQFATIETADRTSIGSGADEIHAASLSPRWGSAYYERHIGEDASTHHTGFIKTRYAGSAHQAYGPKPSRTASTMKRSLR
jgi:hypothetical protein